MTTYLHVVIYTFVCVLPAACLHTVTGHLNGFQKDMRPAKGEILNTWPSQRSKLYAPPPARPWGYQRLSSSLAVYNSQILSVHSLQVKTLKARKKTQKVQVSTRKPWEKGGGQWGLNWRGSEHGEERRGLQGNSEQQQWGSDREACPPKTSVSLTRNQPGPIRQAHCPCLAKRALSSLLYPTASSNASSTEILQSPRPSPGHFLCDKFWMRYS